MTYGDFVEPLYNPLLEVDFCPDYDDPRIKHFDWLLIHILSDEITYFSGCAQRDRTYDAQAVLGTMWDDRTTPRATILRALSTLATLPNCPLVGVRKTARSRERYALR